MKTRSPQSEGSLRWLTLVHWGLGAAFTIITTFHRTEMNENMHKEGKKRGSLRPPLEGLRVRPATLCAILLALSENASPPFPSMHQPLSNSEPWKMFQNLIQQTFNSAVVEKSRRGRREEREIATNTHQWEAQEKKKKPITRRGEAERGEMLRRGRLRRVR